MSTSKKNTNEIEKKQQWKRFGLALILYSIAACIFVLIAPSSDRRALMHLQITLFGLFSISGICYLVFTGTHHRLQSWTNKVHAINQSLNTSQKLYRNVTALFLALLLIEKVSPGRWMIGLLGFFSAFCAFVVLYDATRLYRSLSEHVWGKAVIGLAFAGSSTIAYAIARQEISSVVHVAPTNLIHSTLLMAIMTIPILIVAMGGIVYIASIAGPALILPILQLNMGKSELKTWLFAGLLRESTMRYPIITAIFQCLFYSLLGGLVSQFGNLQILSYEAQLQKILPALIYQLDLYHGSECALTDGEKLAPLGDAKFLIGKKHPNGQIEFLPPIKCDELPTRSKGS